MRKWGTYFLSGRQMREAKWGEAVLNSVINRRGRNGKDKAMNLVCGCGCGVQPYIEPIEKELKAECSFPKVEKAKVHGFDNKQVKGR